MMDSINLETPEFIITVHRSGRIVGDREVAVGDPSLFVRD